MNAMKEYPKSRKRIRKNIRQELRIIRKYVTNGAEAVIVTTCSTARHCKISHRLHEKERKNRGAFEDMDAQTVSEI